MFNRYVKEINESLAKTKKAIIALGCSFVEGQGAVNDELYSDYKWNYKGLGNTLQLDISDEEKQKILDRYPLVNMAFGKLDFTFMELENAFVNVLCKKYFEEEYTPINFGTRGCGNRATIKELYLHPEIDWHLMEECIVVYVPSGLERFDFINDEAKDHFRFKCMWPHFTNLEPEGPRRRLWEGYNKTVWSEKFEVMEQIAHAQELLGWCKLHNAKLIVTPGFDRRYERDYFFECLSQKIIRDPNGSQEVKEIQKNQETTDRRLIDLFPWENMFEPEGCRTFMHLCMNQEPEIKNKNDWFYQFVDRGSPNMWITPCSHPSAKGHDLFAKHLYQHIMRENYV